MIREAGSSQRDRPRGVIRNFVWFVRDSHNNDFFENPSKKTAAFVRLKRGMFKEDFSNEEVISLGRSCINTAGAVEDPLLSKKRGIFIWRCS